MKRKHTFCCADSCIDLGYYILSDSFFMLPKDATTKDQWSKILKIPEKLLKSKFYGKNLKVCSNHFTTDDYRTIGHRKLMKPDVLPTLCLEKGTVESSLPTELLIQKKRILALVSEEGESSSDNPVEKPSEVDADLPARGRPRRKAAQVAAKKMIAATSTEIDDLLRKQEKRYRLSSSDDSEPQIISERKNTTIRTTDGRVICLKDMTIVNSGTMRRTPQTARKSFPSPSPNKRPVKPMERPKRKTLIVDADELDEGIGLEMHCEEDALSSSQISAQKKVFADHQRAMNKIRHLRSENCIIQYEDESVEAAE